APWILKGYGFLTLHLVDVAQAEKYIPNDLDIVQVLPGKTIGGVVLGKYEPGSTLTYGELIVVPALVRQGGQIGAWISHIYVDDLSSVAGGHEIWGLPKESAQFLWQSNGGAIVKQADRILCQFTPTWQFNLWRQRGQFGTYCRLAELARFESEAIATVSLISTQLEIPASSPFATLIKAQPWLALRAESLEVTVAAPRRVG
ncbi:MAG: acetoacetate decarboxylase family protein, partial [Leptolyngbya sp. Prado105]|nr:acetoacetate decarboxylase family protein [Leptolyngbya sp. Prado105]